MPSLVTGRDEIASWMLAAILVLAVLLRLPDLASVPPPLNQDEASRGYDAWAIVETGADRHGQRWPLFLESFGPGDFTAALTTYISVPFVALLGPTVLAMRLPDALLGVLTVLVLYVWLRRQTDSTTALLAAAILAADPWHVALSRTAHESGFTPFFLVLGLLSLHRAGLVPSDADGNGRDRPGGRRRAAAWAFLAGLMLAAGAWAYPATRLFIPLFCLAGLFVYRSHYRSILRDRATRTTLIAAVAGLLVGALPLLAAAAAHPETLAARARVALLIHGDSQPVDIVRGFFRNMAANLDPRYLFLQSDEMSGASIPGVGLHLPVLAPLFAIGLVCTAARWKRSAWSRLLLAWLALYPVPAAVCGDWNPHPMRTVGGILLYPILAAIGGQWLITRVGHATAGRDRFARWRRRAATLAAVLVCANLAHFADAYFREFPLVARPGYQTAMVEAMQRIAPHVRDAAFVYVTNASNQPYIYALIYGPVPPRELAAAEKTIVAGRLGFHQVLQVGKYYFVPRDDVGGAVNRFREAWSRRPTGEGLLIDIDRPGQPPPGEVVEILGRVPVGDSRTGGQIFVLYRWRPPDMPP